MSLLMDLLKKLESQSPKTNVPPTLLKGRDKKSVSRRILILLAPLFLLGAVASYFATQSLLGEEGIKVVRREMPNTQPPKEEQLLKVEEEPEVKAKPPKKYTEEKPEESKPPAESAQTSKEEIRKLTEDIGIKKKTENKKAVAPMNINTLLYLADRSYREGNLEKSREYYEKAFRLKEEERIANNLLVIYVRLGEYVKADALVRKFGSEELAYTYIMELSKKDKRKALKVTERYLSLDRKGLIHFARGYIYEGEGDRERALEEYRKAYSRDRSNPYFGYNYARLLELNRRYREALKVYEELEKEELEPRIKSIVRERIRYLKFMGL